MQPDKLMTSFIRFLACVLLSLCSMAGHAGTLSDIPLSLKGGVPPNVMFALSTEFPTAITAAYQGASDYSASNEYVGYFDPDKCYSYSSANGYFSPIGGSSNHACSTWSGNFLNWATMTGLDEFRYAMTGGQRVLDTAALTVLERTYISNQGSAASNFPNKTFVENGTTTPFPVNGSTVTIQNHARGSQMVILPTGGDTISCASPAVSSGSFSCGSMVLTASGTTASCTAWSGSGTSASPYICTAFTYGGGITGTATKKTVSTASLGTSSSNATVTCSNPGFATPPFSCTLTMGNGATGSCNSWSGSGTQASPYVCTSFSSFSSSSTNDVFTPRGTGNTVANFSATTVGGQVSENVSCTLSSTGPTLTCPMSSSGAASGDKAVCTTFAKDGSGNYKCSDSFGFFRTSNNSASSDENYVSSSNRNNTTSTISVSGKNRSYYLNYTITYTPNVTSNVYYTQTYPGSASITDIYYYTSAYDVAFGASQTYNVRVKVCDSSIGLESNCKQYGSAYKPTGVVQENGDMMRFGVTSYFQANDIDNAVLRSKLKYVAPTKYSAAGQPVANPNAEWSATDGTLVSNPDSSDAATANSYIGASGNTGVINYINKFGTTSQSYKTYDTVGKLYYETLKYLRGKTATPDFYKGAKVSNADGFPVITQWDDPVQYSCQKNYIITIGDTHTWCDKRLPGDSHSGNGNAACNAYTDGNGNAHASDFGSLPNDAALNVSTLTSAVGALEGVANLATNYTGAGGAGYGMAGLSYWAASQDFRPDLPGTQHVQSYVIDVQESRDCGYRSQFWLTSKYGIPDSYDAAGAWLTTNNPAMGTAVISSGGCASNAPPSSAWPKNLLRAGDPQSMISSVRSALTTIAAQIGDEAALAQSSGTLDTGTGAYIYRALYNSGGWQGDLQALAIDTTGTVAAAPAWKASTRLPLPAQRNIFTFNDGLAANGSAETTANSRRGVSFNAASFANLSSWQQALLNNDQFGVADGLGADRVSWVRGDQSKEALAAGTTTANTNPNYGWRSRSPSASTGLTNLLGDVVNSNPVFVAEPAAQPGAGFTTYARSIRARRPAIYVGGNDGMLHAYDASYTLNAAGMPQPTSTSGAELFAYVPGAVYKNLPQLMAPNYSHKYFVDGSPTVVDACFGNAAGTPCSASTSWKTMLVGGLNAGGQGIYALDVTDPTAFSASKVLWEFTDRDDPDLGYTFSKPVVVQLNNQKWAVIFGNGYNNTVADGSASTDGRAYLYVLYVDGPGNGNRWVRNTNYFKIPLISPAEAATPLSPANGLSTVSAVDRDQNGTADIVYAGDRYGQLWKVDLSSAAPSGWAVDLSSGGKPSPLFTAAVSGAVQQVTTGIEVAAHPNGGFMVMFGTGSWVDTSDPFGPYTGNSLYGIWDKDDHSTIVSRSQLQPQKTLAYITSAGVACTAGADDCYGVISNCQPNYGGVQRSAAATALCPATLVASGNTGQQQLGWVMDLPGSGERTRSSAPRISGNVVSFTTLMPATDPCSGNTAGTEYNLSFLTGGATGRAIYVLPGNSTGLVSTTAVPGATAQPIQVVVSSKTISGGASDTPAVFNSTPAATTITVCGGSSGVACDSTFIPGWGFLRNISGPTANAGKYALNCFPASIGDTQPTCIRKTKPGKYGRLDWRQINR
jgi:type IV pilus assembly protein PilY1